MSIEKMESDGHALQAIALERKAALTFSQTAPTITGRSPHYAANSNFWSKGESDTFTRVSTVTKKPPVNHDRRLN